MTRYLRAAAAIAAFALAGEAVAGIPLVNGKEGKLKKFNDNYFEATA